MTMDGRYVGLGDCPDLGWDLPEQTFATRAGRVPDRPCPETNRNVRFRFGERAFLH